MVADAASALILTGRRVRVLNIRRISSGIIAAKIRHTQIRDAEIRDAHVVAIPSALGLGRAAAVDESVSPRRVHCRAVPSVVLPNTLVLPAVDSRRPMRTAARERGQE
jgi:hypothetical protein